MTTPIVFCDGSPVGMIHWNVHVDHVWPFMPLNVWNLLVPIYSKGLHFFNNYYIKVFNQITFQ